MSICNIQNAKYSFVGDFPWVHMLVVIQMSLTHNLCTVSKNVMIGKNVILEIITHHA